MRVYHGSYFAAVLLTSGGWLGVSVKTALRYSNLKMRTVAVVENLLAVAMKTT